MGIGGENMRGKGEGMFEGVLLAGNWIKNRGWRGNWQGQVSGGWRGNMMFWGAKMLEGSR